MSKTDKELTVEVVNNFVSSWNSSHGTSPIPTKNLVELIQTVYTTISSLPEKQDK